MSIEYVTESLARPRDKRFKYRVLMVANGLFALVALFSWTFVSYIVAAPISWATWSPLTNGVTPPFYEYPFILLWGMPAVGIGCAWLADKSGNLKLAKGIALMPVLVLSIIFGWYYIMPTYLL